MGHPSIGVGAEEGNGKSDGKGEIQVSFAVLRMTA
jgi:hypothetical protein